MPLFTKEESAALLQKVRENHRRLDGCGRHAFVDITPEKPLGKRYRCTGCEGEVDQHARYWYERGLQHGMSPSP